MTELPLDQLHPHPDNANRMRPDDLRKLKHHLLSHGRCPAILVRPHPDIHSEFQILDGHHRVIALRELSRTHAPCDIWEVDDDQTRLLLLTLNRLRGEDDPRSRGLLLSQLASSRTISQLAAQLPDKTARIRRLIDSLSPPPMPATFVNHEALCPVTFFLSPQHTRALEQKLSEVSPNRSDAIITLLALHTTGGAIA